jgi:hypothetical protein
MERYIVDAQRDGITHDTTNTLLEFVEWSGKAAERPISYNTIERSFFKEFLYKSALDSPISMGMEDGTNPRMLERQQLVRLMSLFADKLLVSNWDPEIGGRRVESRAESGDPIPEKHLRAWRVAREEILSNIMRWVRLVIANYNAYTGKVVDEDRLLHVPLSEELWSRIANFLDALAALPCWIDRNLSTTVFGPKQNLDYWKKVFDTGKAPNGIQILAKGLDINAMIQPKGSQQGKKS